MQNTKNNLRAAKKKPARAWNADGFYVFWLDGHCEWCGVKTAEDAIALYPEPKRRKIMAVVLKESFPNGGFPVNTDLAFVAVKTRIQKRQSPVPVNPAQLS